MRSVKILAFALTLIAATLFFSPRASAQSPPSNPVTYCAFDNAGSGNLSCNSVSGGSGLGCPPANSLVYAVAESYTVTLPMSVSDGTVSLTSAAATSNGGSNYDLAIFYHYYTTAPGCVTYTATMTGGSFGNLLIAWSTGAAPTSPVDTTDAVATATGANPQVSNNFTTTNANDIIVSSAVCAMGGNNWSAGTGYTQTTTQWRGSANAWMAEYKTVTATGTYTAGFSNSGSCSIGTSKIDIVTVAFKNGSGTTSAHSHSSIISYRDFSAQPKQPWHWRRRKLTLI